MECYMFHINAEYPVFDLHEGIEKLSDLPQEAATRHNVFGLFVTSVEISSIVLDLLIQILNHPLPQAPSADGSKKWTMVCFSQCRWARPERTTLLPAVDDERSCSPHDIHVFASTLARRTVLLELTKSPEILGCLFDVPKIESVNLHLDQTRLSALECQRLGALVQRSIHLKSLTIQGTPTFEMEEKQALVESFTNPFQLQGRLMTESDQSTTCPQHGQDIVDTVVRQGDNVVRPFLCNPPSHLKTLCLTGMHLEDCHFITVVEALPSSQLKELDVSKNNIQCPGILALAEQLPRIKYLKVVHLHSNPWEKNSENGYEGCWAAILQGLRANYCIEILNAWDDSRSALPVLGRYYGYLNWAGRRLLAGSSTVPFGLWPLVLERAGNENVNLDDTMDDPKLRVDAIYFFLQNSLILSVTCAKHSMTNNSRKKNKIME